MSNDYLLHNAANSAERASSRAREAEQSADRAASKAQEVLNEMYNFSERIMMRLDTIQSMVDRPHEETEKAVEEHMKDHALVSMDKVFDEARIRGIITREQYVQLLDLAGIPRTQTNNQTGEG